MFASRHRLTRKWTAPSTPQEVTNYAANIVWLREQWADGSCWGFQPIAVTAITKKTSLLMKPSCPWSTSSCWSGGSLFSHLLKYHEIEFLLHLNLLGCFYLYDLIISYLFMSIKVAHTPWPLSPAHLFTGGIVKKDEAYVELEAMKMIMPLKAGLRTLDRASTCRIKHGKCMVLRLGQVPVPGWVTRWYSHVLSAEVNTRKKWAITLSNSL